MSTNHNAKSAFFPDRKKFDQREEFVLQIGKIVDRGSVAAMQL